MTRRLIEDWLPIAALGEESVRERRSMTSLPPTYYLHVWWARRPLVASRAAILGSLLPADTDRAKFLHMVGIHGDPVAAKRLMDRAKRTGVRVTDPYGYSRAFGYLPTAKEREWFSTEAARISLRDPRVLDPTAGGGSIPFESARLSLPTLGNDLNPVAALVQRATVEWPITYGREVQSKFKEIAAAWRERLEPRLRSFFPQEDGPEQIDTTYVWARTIRCPHCEGIVPLAPNWRLAPDGTGIQLVPNLGAGPGDEPIACLNTTTVSG